MVDFMLFPELLPIKIYEDKILLNVKITPKAAKNRIGKTFNESLKIYVTAAAEAGQANKSVIELLAKELKISKSSITITQGLTSPNKVISLVGEQISIIKHLQMMILG